MTDMIAVPTSPGEVLDRITILELKATRLEEPKKSSAQASLDALQELFDNFAAVAGLELTEGELMSVRDHTGSLRRINCALWLVEDNLRRHEKNKNFDAAFVEDARSVYLLNDQRHSKKVAIDNLFKCKQVEVKGY